MPDALLPDPARLTASRNVQGAMHTQVVTIHPGASLPEAVVSMQTLGVRRLLVVDEGKLVGLLTDEALDRALPPLKGLSSTWDAAFQIGQRRVGEVMRREVFTALPGDTLAQAASQLLERHVGGLPVVDESGKLLGILTLTDVLRSATASAQPGWGSVAEWMSGELIVVPPDMPLGDAAARLSDTRLRVLPVVAGGVLLGVLHEQDLRALRACEGSAPWPTPPGEQMFRHGQRVRDLMKPPGAEVLGTAPLTEAMQVMLDADVHGLPVVDEHHTLLGVITVSDLLRAILSSEQH